MSNSKLVDYKRLSPHKSSRNGRRIKKITIHHMAGDLSVEECGAVFMKREASANYGVDSDGRIGLYVDEKYRAWTSSNRANDEQAVTIEVANDGGAPNWHVSAKALEATIDLCVDICKRNGIKKLNYNGKSSGTLTRHNMFAATTCPGPYLQSKFNYIESEVNRRLAAKKTTTTTKKTTTSSSSFRVQVTANTLNIRAGAGEKYDIIGQIKDKGVYTIVKVSGKWGLLKAGPKVGSSWIHLDYTKRV